MGDGLLNYQSSFAFSHPNITFPNGIKHKGGLQGNKDRRTTVPRDAGLGRGTMDESAKCKD